MIVAKHINTHKFHILSDDTSLCGLNFDYYDAKTFEEGSQKAENLLQSLVNKKRYNFCWNCWNCYIILADEIKKEDPIDNDILEDVITVLEDTTNVLKKLIL